MSEYEVEFGEFLSYGGYSEALEHLTRSIAAICRRDRGVTKFYIGKASGHDPTTAIEGRYDHVKVKHQFTEDWALFQSENSDLVIRLEVALIRRFKGAPSAKYETLPNRAFYDDPRCVNISFSRSQPAAQPLHFIYLALKRA
jgi:hypothetical protein